MAAKKKGQVSTVREKCMKGPVSSFPTLIKHLLGPYAGICVMCRKISQPNAEVGQDNQCQCYPHIG